MPWYVVINGKKQEMDEDIFDQMVEVLHQSKQPSQSTNPSNVNTMESRRNVWQETIRP